jgi:hypothetical protein
LTAHGCPKPGPPGVDSHPEKTSGPHRQADARLGQET